MNILCKVKLSRRILLNLLILSIQILLPRHKRRVIKMTHHLNLLTQIILLFILVMVATLTLILVENLLLSAGKYEYTGGGALLRFE